MRKLFNSLIACTLTIGMLAGCGSSSTANSSSSSPEASSSPETNNSVETSSASSGEVNVEPAQLTIGTASSGGAFYVIGTGIAEVITKYVEPLNVTAEITGGSAENIRLVGEGDSDMGISNASDVYFGYTGTETFDGTKYDLTAIASLHSSVLHIVTTENSGITSIDDLKGKKVAVGPAGGGSIYPFTLILNEYGLDFDKDITASYLSYDDGIEQLKDGQVDAALVMAGRNASSIQSLEATEKVVLLDTSDAAMTAIAEKCPFYYATTIKADVYGTDHDAKVLGCNNLLFCNASLDEDTVYAITKAIIENFDEIKSYHAAMKAVDVNNCSDTAGVPLHPGAEKYYSEAGMLK